MKHRKQKKVKVTAVEAFADSELENLMVDITEVYKNRNEVVAERTTKLLKTTEAGSSALSLYCLSTSVSLNVGEVTDVTDRYSADQITSLDGLVPRM